MARGAVPVHQIGRGAAGFDIAGFSPTTGDAVNGHSVANNGRTYVAVKNTGVTARIVTFKTVKSVDGLAVATDPQSIAAGHEIWYGPFPTDVYGGSLEIDVAHAELTLKAWR